MMALAKKLYGIGVGVALAVLCPSTALASDPAGMLQSEPVSTPFPSAEACVGALETWVAEQRQQQRDQPTIAPDQWTLAGPTSDREGHIRYQLTRIVVTEDPGVRSTVAYIYERWCGGSQLYFVSDGWTRMDVVPPKETR